MTDEASDKTTNIVPRLRRLVLIGSITALIALAAYVVRFLYAGSPLSDNPADWSAFGEYYGGAVGPVLAFLALLLLVMTLEVQLRELSFSRQAMESSAESLQTQIEISRIQRADQTYFHFLQLYHSTISLIRECGNSGSNTTGHQLLGAIYRRMKEFAGGESALTSALEAFDKLHVSYDYALEHFYNTTALILEFSSTSAEKDKQVYADRFRAQVSTPEMGLLFYYGLTDRGRRMKALFEEFHFFKDLPSDELISPDHARHYEHLVPTRTIVA